MVGFFEGLEGTKLKHEVSTGSFAPRLVFINGSPFQAFFDCFSPSLTYNQ